MQSGDHFLDSIEVGIDRVSSRHHSHPTFDCGIVTLRYGLPYDTRVRSKASLTNMVLWSLAARMVLMAVTLFRSALLGAPSLGNR